MYLLAFELEMLSWLIFTASIKHLTWTTTNHFFHFVALPRVSITRGLLENLFFNSELFSTPLIWVYDKFTPQGFVKPKACLPSIDKYYHYKYVITIII